MIYRIPLENSHERILIEHLTGVALFLFLYIIEKYIKMISPIRIVYSEIDKVSYEFYLFQTNMAINISVYWNIKGYFDAYILLLFVFLLSYLCAKVLSVFVNYIVGTNAFMALENLFQR